ncbi:hypothetical protein QBC33DRAFT_451095 [Phialemonium atrogriseum]|uniref:Uncharacterized protein n=1 Tax=Phialemonium atrogriseum TaxID=1093897 RepID=A0AAJ0FHF9_9PEZI|nr:uncharacterized protein QBC33DRAFT_451095 [Phialemonium atrogriseum]KAK1767667.1 hypothetical protein QBC33DRAFT_451095 [Phialemonium atrogriseum]
MSRDDDSLGGWNDGQFDPSSSRPPPGENEAAWVLRNANRLGIDYDSLPQTPFWSPLFGQGQDWYRANIASKVIGFSVLLKRELSQQEKDAVSFHAAKECATRALEPPAAVVAAYAFERRGRDAFRFPFWKPKPTTINPDVFPGQIFTLLRGRMAWSAWHATRFSCYAFVSHMVLSGIFTSYAMSVWVANMKLDPRLATLRKAMEETGKQGRLGRRLGEQGADPGGWQSPSQGEDPSMQDAPYPYGQTPGDVPSSGGRMEAEETRRQSESAARARDRGYPTPGPAYASPQDSASQSQDDDAHLFDDASPMAPSDRGKNATTSASGGSSWDKLRNQAMSGGNTGGQAGPRIGQRSSDGYTYSSADEDKSYAKQQAQKEFDAMLEKERRGEADVSGRRF